MNKLITTLVVLFLLIGCQTTTKHISTNICDSVERIHSVSLAYNLAANLGDKEYSADIVKPFLGLPEREEEIDGNLYYFYQESKDCEVSIEVKDTNYEGSGMDGSFTFPKNILVSNYWNIDLMKQNEIFDTQKGIIRKTTIQDVGIESIDFHGKNINANKFILNAEKHPKDKGPFSETSIWYDKNNELVQFSFNSPKDKSLITIIRSK